MTKPNDQFVQVQIVTTSGSYPAAGHDQVPSHQKVKVELAQAGHKLELTDTSGWMLSLNGREIDPEKSWIDYDLHGTIQLDWGPREGGGGMQ